MERKYVKCDTQACTGCQLCEMICSAGKVGAFSSELSRIHVVRLDPDIAIAVSCRLCEDAPCVEVCPRDALSVHPETGSIVLERVRCTGCGWCIEACDFGAITLDPSTKSVAICDLCPDCEEPRCVANCPRRALSLASAGEVASKARGKAARSRLID